MRFPRLPGAHWLDVTLAVRMLVRYPGLALVSGLALASGIPAPLAPIPLIRAINGPLPFDEADRILGLEHWDLTRARDIPSTIHDFERWQRELTSFESLAATRRQ